MGTDVRQHCRKCFHDNDSHDPLIGCLMPGCWCEIRHPASDQDAQRPLRATTALRQAAPTRATHRTRHARQRSPWRVLRWFLASTAGAILAAILLAGSFLLAVAILVAMGGPQ